MTLTKEAVLNILKTIQEPELGSDYVSLNMVKEIVIDGKNLTVAIELTTPACPMKQRIADEIEKKLREGLNGLEQVHVNFTAQVKQSRGLASEDKKIPGIKNVIAVGSGKGGVGKSTVAVNLALALHKMGARVGLLDADLYGPSMPVMFGIQENEKPQVVEGSRIIPLERYGLPIMSIGFIIGSGDAVVWRGPMLDKMIRQFLEQVQWGDLDYLVVDLPPGTGDVQLSLSQRIPLSGAVAVTTPQDVALADVRRAVKMFEMLKVPMLGVVENMSSFICPHCKKETSIFGVHSEGAGGYKGLGLPLLGSLPLDPQTALSGDEGKPVLIRDPHSAQAERFMAIASQIAASQSVMNFKTAS